MFYEQVRIYQLMLDWFKYLTGQAATGKRNLAAG